jgi:hypothetical protein
MDLRRSGITVEIQPCWMSDLTAPDVDKQVSHGCKSGPTLDSQLALPPVEFLDGGEGGIG